MRKIEAVGIGVTVAMAPLYVVLMKSSGEPIEWFVVGFILFIAVALTLYATVLRKFTENTKENRDAALSVIKKAAEVGIGKIGK
jgi:predicted MFS family arabinose efflux permease